MIWALKNFIFFHIFNHFISSFHGQCVSQLPPPLDCDWSVKSTHQDTDAEATCSGSIIFLSLTLVTKKHRFLPGTCETEGGSAAIPPNPGLCLNRNSTFWYSFLKSASSLVLKLMSAVMQIALVLSDRRSSLSVIRMLFENSVGISNFVLKFLPMVGSAPFRSSSRPLVSLTSLSFFIINFSVSVSPTPTPRSQRPGTWLKLSCGISSGRSVAVQLNNGLSDFTCFFADTSTC